MLHFKFNTKLYLASAAIAICTTASFAATSGRAVLCPSIYSCENIIGSKNIIDALNNNNTAIECMSSKWDPTLDVLSAINDVTINNKICLQKLSVVE